VIGVNYKLDSKFPTFSHLLVNKWRNCSFNNRISTESWDFSFSFANGRRIFALWPICL